MLLDSVSEASCSLVCGHVCVYAAYVHVSKSSSVI